MRQANGHPATAATPARPHGYTVVELVVVMSLVAILAASVLPKFTSATGMRDQAWHDEVLAAARMARSTATSHRRVVCLSFSGSSVSLTIDHLNPGTGCTTSVSSPTGSAVFASSDNSRSEEHTSELQSH